MIKYNIFPHSEPYIVLDDYFHVFNNHLPATPHSMLLNEEQIIVIYPEYDNIKVNYKHYSPRETLSILAVGGTGDDEYLNFLRLASLLNKIKGDIILTGTGPTINKMKDCVNAHIRLKDIRKWESSPSLDVHMVIGYGPGLLFFMKQYIPVMIVGPLGLGGLVTTTNFHALEKNGFNGRPGGRLWEEIPQSLYAEEFSELKSWLPETFHKISELASASSFITASCAEEYLKNLSAHRNKIYDENERWNLIPKVCSNIMFGRSGNGFYASRKLLNDTLAMFEDVTFFSYLKQRRSFLEILKLLEEDPVDYWNFVYSIIKQNIITY